MAVKPVPVEFLSICEPIEETDYSYNASSGRNTSEFLAYGGFIDFYNGGRRYSAKDCPSVRAYLESYGYSFNPTTEYPIQTYTHADLFRVLKEEGPESPKYRFVLSCLVVGGEPYQQTWGRLDKAYEMYGIGGPGTYSPSVESTIRDLAYNSPYVANQMSSDADFLRTTWGRYSILNYANSYGINRFDEVADMMTKRGIYSHKTGIDAEDFIDSMHRLDGSDQEYFDGLLAEAKSVAKGNNKNTI